MTGLRGFDDGLVWFEVLADPLVDGLLANLVVVGGLHFYHVFQICNFRLPELLALRVCSSAPCKLLVNINASVSLPLCRSNFQRFLVLLLDRHCILGILLSTCNNRHPVVF